MTLTDTRATDTDESTPAAEEGSSAAPEKKSPRERFKNFGDPNTVARFAGRALALIHGGGKNDPDKDAAQRNAKRAARRRKDTPDRDELTLELRSTIGNVTLTGSEVMVWYVMGQRSNSFMPVSHVNRLISADALAHSKLVGRRCQIRISTRPHSVYEWAERTWDDARRNGKPIENGEDQDASCSGMLMRDQQHLRRANFSDKWVYFGVRVATARRFPKDPQREVDELASEIAELNYVLAGSSLAATAATTEDMEWLLRRSVSLGLPCAAIGMAEDYEPKTVELLQNRARMTGEPYEGYVKVTGTVEGEERPVTRYVSVLTLARLSDQNIPENIDSGWMQRTDAVSYPVEWSAIFDVQSPTKTNKFIIDQMNKIRDQMEHYVSDHKQDPPEMLKRQNTLGKQIQGEIQGDHGGLEVRTEGWYRVAVSAPTLDALDRRVAEIRNLYGSKADLERTAAQWHVAREFIPGEGLQNSGFSRTMSVKTLAAAIPQGTANIGDRDGAALGYTAGSALRGFSWNMHRDMESRDRSGLTVIAAGLGGGKSYVLGSIVYRAVMQGTRFNVLDPSDRLGRLCDLPELKNRSRYINLMRGRSGELGPYRVVADPKREHYDTDTEYQREISAARGTRRSLMRDILESFISPKLLNDAGGVTASVITRALKQVEPVRTSTATDVLVALEKIEAGELETQLTEEHRIRAGDVLEDLRQAAETPIGRLIFPPEGEPAPTDDDLDVDDNSMLNVYTLNGIRIPKESSITAGDTTITERLSMAVVQLAAWLVQSRMYEGDRAERKGLAIDEGKTLSAISAGKTLITKSATDSRKFNARVLLSSQDVTHFEVGTGSPDALDNLVGTVFIGHTEGERAQQAALQLMGVPLNQGYETLLGQLRPATDRRREKSDAEKEQMTEEERMAEAIADRRHFIFFDGSGHERVVIDTDAHPHVKKALNSRPKSDLEAEAEAAAANTSTTE